MNGLTFLALIALALGIFVAYRLGGIHARRTAHARPSVPSIQRAQVTETADPTSDQTSNRTSDQTPNRTSDQTPEQTATAPPAAANGIPPASAPASAALRDSAAWELAHLRELSDERTALFRALADARAETARYRQIVVDLERNAPPPLLDAPGTPDDLKLIVGVGPVIERMLYQMGIATYRQIARLTERDIDEIEARLREFPGRIRRDGWVTQARALHVGKYGSNP